MEKLKQKANSLTTQPGVYLMKDKNKKVIYVGKAKSLKARVSSYFRQNSQHDQKVEKMVSVVDDFDYIVTDSEFEALVLECSLIKQYNPKYNILLKDDKGYHYIYINDDGYKKITVEKQKIKKGEYIGPYTSSFSVKQAVEQANNAFMLPVCSLKFPQDIKKQRPCLNYHIKKCYGACLGNLTEQQHNEIVKQAVEFLKGSTEKSIKKLESDMNKAAEELDFELAAKLRDKIKAIRRIEQKQRVVGINQDELDVIAISKLENVSCGIVMKIRNNKLVDKADFVFNDSSEINQQRNSFIKGYYLSQNDIAKSIIVDSDFEDKQLLEEYLTEQKGKKVSISIPQRGELKKLVLMAKNNATEQLTHRTSKNKELLGLEELKDLLLLKTIPRYIEAYDISNIGDTNIVGGMIVFKDGLPFKSGYKKFKIKTVVGQDDYASMSEVITRRLNRYLNDENSSFKTLPDLILLDGGKGHVSTIKKVLEQYNLDIPVFGMVKDNKHKTRAITMDDCEIEISYKKLAFSLITKIQNEVHRFAITFQRNRSRKTMLNK